MSSFHSELSIKVPELFLKVPETSVIDEKPDVPYDLPVKGRVHSNKFKQMIDVFISDEPNKEKKLHKILQGHNLQHTLQALPFRKFIDLVFHITYANRDQLGWDVADLIISKLKEYYIPRWEIPHLDFSQVLSSIRNSFIANNIPSEIKDEIRILAKELEQYYDENEFKRKVKLDKHLTILDKPYISLHWLFDLYSKLNSIIKYKVLIDIQYYENILEYLIEFFIEYLEGGNFNDEREYVLFVCMVIDKYLIEKNDIIQTCNDLYMKALRKLEKIGDEDYQSYHWLLDAAQARISALIIRYRGDMVIKNILLNSLTPKFLNPETVDLNLWSSILVESGLEVSIFIQIMKGYESVFDLLTNYACEVEDESVMPNINKLLTFLYETIWKYMAQLVNIPNTNAKRQIINDLISSSKLKNIELEELLNLVLDISIEYYVTQKDPQINDDNYNLLRHIQSQLIRPLFREPHLLELGILTGKQNRERIVETILHEFESADTLIGCQTFEIKIILPYAEIFNMIQLIEKNTGILQKSIYEKLIVFLIDFLNGILQSPELAHEALIIVLPFVQVCLTMIERYYDSRKKQKESNLIYLNQFLLKLYLSVNHGYPKVSSLKEKKNTEELFEDFLEVLQDFDFGQHLNMDEFKVFAIDSSALDDMVTEFEDQTSKKFDEDNIMEYMDSTDDLQEFLKKINDLSQEELIEHLDNADFTAGSGSYLTSFQRIALHLKNSSTSNIKFPLIPNIHYYAAAFELFPMELDFPKFGTKLEL